VLLKVFDFLVLFEKTYKHVQKFEISEDSLCRNMFQKATLALFILTYPLFYFKLLLQRFSASFSRQLCTLL